MTRVLIVDDHPLFRDGFAHLVRNLRPDWHLTSAASVAEALAAVAGACPDLVTIDVGLPDGDGFALLAAIRERCPAVPQILISGRDDAAVRMRAHAVGARGFLTKTVQPEVILQTIDAVLAGQSVFAARDTAALPELTQRQTEVLLLLGEGHGNKEIRHRLGIAERTVRAHLTDLFHALGAHSRMQAVVRARELGLIA